MRIRSLVVLTHALQGLPAGSLMACLVEVWRAEGRKVTVHSGLQPPPGADACLLHVDLSVVPPEYLALMEPFAQRINGAVVDITRRASSDALVTPDDRFAGPVIVKTDLNHYGRPEALLRRRVQPLRQRLREMASVLPVRWTGGLAGGDYHVLPSKAAVPDWVWRAPELVVERFHGATGGARNHVDLWYFLGRRSRTYPIEARAEVFRWGPGTDALPTHDEPQPEAEPRRRALGFDYGKFDLIRGTDGLHAVDTNRTPFAAEPLSELEWDLARHLAPGLDDYAA